MTPPAEFLRRMEGELKEEFPAFLHTYDLPPEKGFRINTGKISRAEFLYRFGDFAQVPWEENGFYAQKSDALLHAAGLVYMQEPSAMAAAPKLGATENDRVLDLCAAPGGKATRLALSSGLLIANEVDFGRAQILTENVERWGLKNVAVTCATPLRLAEEFPRFFDKILVDAPCSGEGMFKKEPEAAVHWSKRNVELSAARQQDILDAAQSMLAGGGRLVYSTCTFSREEDEEQIASFLQRFPDFRLLSMEKLLPHRVRGEGHFVAVLMREEGERGEKREYAASCPPAAMRAFSQFAEDFFECVPQGKISMAGEKLYLVPAGMPELKARLVRLGVLLGGFDGKRFTPAHALAMAFGPAARRKISLAREEAMRYVHGETVSSSLPDGWCCVFFEEFPLGLGKCVNGVVKNHYPKHLRI